MSTRLEELMFKIALLDRVSAPVKKIQKVMKNMANDSQKAFSQVGTGAAGIAGAGFGLLQFTQPAEQMRRALGDVDSLDVSQTVLKDLSSKALKYSIKYGRAADDFVGSAYDIQSSINGLKGNDLAEFTNVANVLGVAGKSDAATMTNYMGTMYGIFKGQAEKMGKVNWVKQLAGQTATAIQIFKTTGSEMSAAFTSVGANATAAGIGVVEQFAILGKLQSTMSGSEAGTKYKAFLAGVGNAQKSLGLSFVDSQGNMLGMMDILTKLRGKFGNTFDVAESDALKKAFGSDEAVSLIKLLMADMNGLAGSMDKLGHVTGMGKAMEMASKRVTPLMRGTQGLTALITKMGTAMTPVFDTMLNGFAGAASKMIAWMDEYPTLTKWIGFSVVVVSALVASMGALSMVMGLSKLGMIGLTPAIAGAKWAMALFTKQGIIAKTVMWLLNTAFWANPAVWLAAAVVGLVVGVAALIYKWDSLKAAFMDSSWGKAIMKIIDKIMGGFKSLNAPIEWVSNKVGALAGYFGFGGDNKPMSSPSLNATKQISSVPGGVANHIANTVSNHNSNSSRSVGKVENHFHQRLDRQEMEEAMLMGAG